METAEVVVAVVRAHHLVAAPPGVAAAFQDQRPVQIMVAVSGRRPAAMVSDHQLAAPADRLAVLAVLQDHRPHTLDTQGREIVTDVWLLPHRV